MITVSKTWRAACAVADRLISTNFHNTITRGFAGAGDLDTAVCLRPGTELAFDTAPRYQYPITHWEHTAPSNVARFRQIDLNIAFTHHDALEFSDGTIVPLACLLQGQWATVLQLPSVPLTSRNMRQRSLQTAFGPQQT